MNQTIDGSKLDPQFKYDVARHPGGENVTMCYSCGTCTASCPAAAVDDEYNPRKIIRQILLGMREEVLASPLIWRCVLCYACYATCPQNVKFRDVMQVLRAMAVEEGYVRASLNREVADLDRRMQILRRDLVQELVAEPEACERRIQRLEDVGDHEEA